MPHVLYLNISSSRFHTDKRTHEEPRAVCVAWLRDDHEHPVCRLIEPVSGMTIAPETLPYHGLTIERLAADGVAPEGVIKELEAAADNADALVSYNAAFHWRQLYRLMGVQAQPPASAVCAMDLAAPILQIPPSRGQGWKSPSLREACEFFGVPAPDLDEPDPIERAYAILRAVRGVYEACNRPSE